MPGIGFRIDEALITGSVTKLEKELRSLEKFHLDCVELPVNGLDIIRDGYIDQARLKQAIKVLKKYNYIYTIHCADSMNLMDENNFNDHLKLFASSLEICQKIGSHVFVYHPGRFIPEEEFALSKRKAAGKKDRERLLKEERSCISKLAGAYPNVKICMENLRPYKGQPDYCYSEKPDSLIRQASEINCPNVGITLDMGHLNLSAIAYKYDLMQAVKNAKKYIMHAHVHDNFGKINYHHEKNQSFLIPPGKGDCHMPPGWGNTPVKKVIDSLKDIYRGMYVLELRSRYREELGRSVEYLKRITG